MVCQQCNYLFGGSCLHPVIVFCKASGPQSWPASLVDNTHQYIRVVVLATRYLDNQGYSGFQKSKFRCMWASWYLGKTTLKAARANTLKYVTIQQNTSNSYFTIF